MSQVKYPTEVISLPSEGKFYPEGHPLASGQLELKYMTTREEDILTSSNLIKKNLVFDKFYDSLIVDPKVRLNDMLTGDVNAIMVASRILGYGKEYPVNITCPKCDTQQTFVADLTDLHQTSPETSVATQSGTTFKIELPISRAVVEFKLMTRGDEKKMEREIEGYKKALMDAVPETAIFFNTIIVSVDGNDDPLYIRQFVDALLVKDSRFLKDVYNKTKPDIDFNIQFLCDSCSEESEVRLPIGLSFFWPTAGV